LPERTHLGFNWAGWRLALIGVAVGTVLGLRMQIRFGGHATGGEAAFFMTDEMFIVTILMWLTAALFVLTPFLKPRPVT
jgi:hypothetical protein